MRWAVIYLVVSFLIAWKLHRHEGPYKRNMEQAVKDKMPTGFFICQGIVLILLAPLLFIYGVYNSIRISVLRRRYAHHIKMVEKLGVKIKKEIDRNDEKRTV